MPKVSSIEHNSGIVRYRRNDRIVPALSGSTMNFPHWSIAIDSLECHCRFSEGLPVGPTYYLTQHNIFPTFKILCSKGQYNLLPATWSNFVLTFVFN